MREDLNLLTQRGETAESLPRDELITEAIGTTGREDATKIRTEAAKPTNTRDDQDRAENSG